MSRSSCYLSIISLTVFVATSGNIYWISRILFDIGKYSERQSAYNAYKYTRFFASIVFQYDPYIDPSTSKSTLRPYYLQINWHDGTSTAAVARLCACSYALALATHDADWLAIFRIYERYKGRFITVIVECLIRE